MLSPQFSMREDKLLFQQVQKWMIEGQNDKVKYILENTMQEDLPDGKTFLHHSAHYGNSHIIEYLMAKGFVVDIRDNMNITPLMHAINNQRWEAAKTLLKYNADIFAVSSTGESPLANLMKTPNPNLDVLLHFFDRVRNTCADKKEFVEMLRTAGCKLDLIMHLHDAEVTEIFLDAGEFIGYEVECASIDIAMRSMDAENMKLLLHHGNINWRRERFLLILWDILEDSYYDESLDIVVQTAVEQIVEWKFLDSIIIHFLDSFFHQVPANLLRKIWNDRLVSYINSDFNYDIRVHIFGNSHPCVLKMIKNGEVDISALSRKGRTALHIATYEGARENMEYILDCGVNPNITDNNGRTPVFKVHVCQTDNKDTLKLLLLYGADLQAFDKFGKTYVDYHTQNFTENLSKTIIAHLAILEVSGVTLKESFRNFTCTPKDMHIYFVTCCEQLEKLKVRYAHKSPSSSLSLFETLAESLESLSRRVTPLNHEIIDKFFSTRALEKYDTYYVSMMRDRLRKAITIRDLREKAAAVIRDSIEVLKPYDLVIEKICRFLSYYNLYVFE